MIQLTLTLMLSILSFADTTGMTSAETKKELTQKELAERFQVNGELFVLSADGKRLLYRISQSSTGAPNKNSFKVVSNWGHEQNTGDKIIPIFIRNEFQIEKDGAIKAHIQQFESMKPDQTKGSVQYGKLLKEEKMDLIDFSIISWPVYSDSKIRIVARLTPILIDRGQSYSPSDLPIALEDAVLVDGKGNVWANGLSQGGGKYVALITHKGTLAISYFPFSGAKEIGVARGNEMIFNEVTPSLNLKNSKPFLTANGEMKVYGMVLPNRKTERLHSVHMDISDKEQEFLKRLK